MLSPAVQYGEKHVVLARGAALCSSHHRKVAGPGHARYVDVVRAGDGDTQWRFLITAAQVRRPQERARGVYPGDEGIGCVRVADSATVARSLVLPVSTGEIARIGVPGDISVAFRVNRDGPCVLQEIVTIARVASGRVRLLYRAPIATAQKAGKYGVGTGSRELGDESADVILPTAGLECVDDREIARLIARRCAYHVGLPRCIDSHIVRLRARQVGRVDQIGACGV